ncbi:MAG: PEP-CTERM sorting domain-containing protein [Phycisphaerae bacterium]
MKKLIVICAVVTMILVVSTGALAVINLTDLSESGVFSAKYNRYVYGVDRPAEPGDGDITIISFDYSCGDDATYAPEHAAFRIRALGGATPEADGANWLSSFNIHPGSYNLDTDYGPSVSSDPLASGVNHYEFTLNRSTGEWDLALNGIPGVLVQSIPELGGVNYFSDESPEAYANAIGTPFEPYVGIGGTGGYRILFEEASGGSVDNIQITNIPEPTTITLLLFGASSLIRKKR